MTGPDPADVMGDLQGPDKPQVPIGVPSIQKYVASGGNADDPAVDARPLLRQQKQQELDTTKQHHLEQAVQELQSSASEYNRQLKRPHRTAIRL